MKTRAGTACILVLAGRRGFEALAGPVPEDLAARFVFAKPHRERRLRRQLSNCRLVISKNYPRPDLNRWIFEARHRGIPSLLLVDGPLEWSNLYANPSLEQPGAEAAQALFEPVVHDAVATIGRAQSRWIESRNPGRGLITFEYANRRIWTRPDRGPEARRQGESPPPAGAAPEPVSERDFEFDVLLTTARTAAFDARESAELGRALEACSSALETAGLRTLVRIFDDRLREPLRVLAPQARFEITGSFASALARSHSVIGTPSSVLLEAMLHDKPTATLIFREHRLFYETGWRLEAGADWAPILRAMAARDPARMERQRATLEENLAPTDFYQHCRQLLEGGLLDTPRPFDALDRGFEDRVRAWTARQRRRGARRGPWWGWLDSFRGR